jgi:predicted HAD superfamily phosphohydrolase YqeG
MAGTVSNQNSHNAQNSRNRKQSELKTQIADSLKTNPDDSFRDRLNRLQGDGTDGVVTSWDNQLIKWRDDLGTEKTTKASTVKSWISELRKATTK